MKTNTKFQPYATLRHLIFLTNTSLRKLRTPLSYTALQKLRTPLYVSLLGVVAVTGTSFKKKLLVNTGSVTSNTYSVLVIKNKYELQVYDSAGEWIVTYPVVFGNKDLGDKLREGDRKTPEGVFHIANKRKHEKWNSMMLLDYPTQDSYRKFNERKAHGLIPKEASIGGAIGIHGTWEHEDYAIDQYQNWTEGCISTKNKYIQEIFALLPVGTKVEIRRN